MCDTPTAESTTETVYAQQSGMPQGDPGARALNLVDLKEGCAHTLNRKDRRHGLQNILMDFRIAREEHDVG